MSPLEPGCPADEQLLAVIKGKGRLSPAEEEAIKKHLDIEKCPGCARRVERLVDPSQSTIDHLQDIELGPPPPIPHYEYARKTDGGPLFLGQGGMGEVYKVFRPGEPAKFYAVKLLFPGLGHNSRFRERFVLEYTAVARLKSDAIVRAYEFGATDSGRLYYVMDFVEGPNLFEYQRGGTQRPAPLAPPDAFQEGISRFVARCFRQVAEGMRDAHERDLIHRDLKPGNVLVCANEWAGEGLPRLKVCDFGLVRRLSATTALTEGEVLGTRLSMAPEQLDGTAGLSPSPDIYGLGVILYFMLTGRPLFEPSPEAGPAILDDLVRRIDPLPPRSVVSGVDSGLETICLVCLRKGPADRYQTVAELLDDVDRFLDGRPIRARRYTRLERTVKWARANPWQTAVMALAGMCILSLGIALFFLNKSATTFREKLTAEEREVRAKEGQLTAEREKGKAVAGQLEAQRALGKEQQRALAAEREKLVAVRLRQLGAARAFLARGRLREARRLFDELLPAATEPEKVSLRVERLPTLFAYGQWSKLESELKALGEEPGLMPRQRAEVLLHRGDYTLWDWAPDRQRAGRADLEAGLAIPNGLRPADAAYARGVLAIGATEAIGHFRKAVEAGGGRFHLRANAALLLELTLTGQFDQARRQADFMRSAFPEEVVTPLALALAALCEQNHPLHRRHRDELARLMGDRERMAGIDATFRALDAVFRAAAKGDVKEARQDIARALLGQMGLMAFKAMLGAKSFAGVSSVVGVGLPSLQRPVHVLQQTSLALELINRGKDEEAIRLLSRLETESPEALLRQVRWCAEVNLAKKKAEAGDGSAFLRRAGALHALMVEAADAPTLLPFLTNRQNFRWACVMVESGFEAQRRRDSAAGMSGAVGLAASPPAAPLGAVCLLAGLRHHLAQVPVPPDDRQLRRALADSRPGDRSRAEAVPYLLENLDVPAELARTILYLWSRDEPANLVPLFLRTRLELSEGNFDEAVRTANRGLSLPFSFRQLELRGYRELALRRQRVPFRSGGPSR
jgi:hypothetical protein